MESLGGWQYYVTFIDNFSHYLSVDFLRSKSDTLQAYRVYTAWVNTQFGVRIKRFHSNHGDEYTGDDFTDFLRQQGTERCLTTAETPQHNGVAEVANQCLLEHVHAMLIQTGLPKALWAEAVRFSVWLKNRTPTKFLGLVSVALA